LRIIFNPVYPVAVNATPVEAPVNVVPPAFSRVRLSGAAHFRPVGETVESATMLQLGKGIILGSAQSCANVLDKRIIPILNCELWN
jgi:hypothetical protein